MPLNVVQAHRRGGHFREQILQICQGQKHHHTGVLDNEPEPVRRKSGVQWHIGRVDLEHREHYHVAAPRRVEEQGNTVPGPRAADQKMEGELIGPGVQFLIAQDDVASVHRNLPPSPCPATCRSRPQTASHSPWRQRAEWSAAAAVRTVPSPEPPSGIILPRNSAGPATPL